MSKRKTYEEIKKIIELDSNSGCKLLSKEYRGNKHVLEIKCSCGDEYNVSFNNFMTRNKRQCNKCGRRLIAKSRQKTHEKFMIEFEKINNGEYEIISRYDSSDKKMKILHKKCGKINEVVANNILRGVECFECSYESRSNKRKFDYEYVYNYIKNKKHLLMDENYINCDKIINIKCPNGHIFESTFFLFKNKKYRCPKCRMSRGEKLISEFLNYNNINYKTQYRFDDCKNIKSLPFDFAIFDINNNLQILIEYDGRQHFQPVEIFGGRESFKETKKRDEIKNNYCKDNNIILIRIPYWDFNQIENILNENLKIHKK